MSSKNDFLNVGSNLPKKKLLDQIRDVLQTPLGGRINALWANKESARIQTLSPMLGSV